MTALTKAKLPIDFKANGLSCGIKKSGRLDLGLIFSNKPAIATGLFTSNKITSGSVKLCQRNLAKSRYFQAIIINSGNANCFTKQDPVGKANQVTSELSSILKIKKQEILIASTGIIGKTLPVNKIKRSIPILVKGLRRSGLISTAKAILTTDTFIKLSAVKLNIGKRIVTICGLAKGAGMIAPNLSHNKATMLCFILSDVNITKAALDKALSSAVDNSFNCITIDGCMSTNDTSLMMSNAAALNPKIKEGSRDFIKYSAGLNQVCLSLAKMIVGDAEGASKFIQIKVKGAKTNKQAKQIALNIANSDLFKTAVFGRNRNVGRVIAAIGASGADISERNINIKVSALNKRNIYVTVTARAGNGQASVYTSDLTPGYIKINAAYN